MKPSPEASKQDAAERERELWRDVEMMAEHRALSCELRERGLSPVLPAAEGEGKTHPSRSSRLRRMVVGFALALGCLAGSAGLSALYANLYSVVLEMGAREFDAGVLESNLGGMAQRGLLVEMARSLRTPADPTLSAEEAAEALHTLQQAGNEAGRNPALRPLEGEYLPLKLDFREVERLFPALAASGRYDMRDWYQELLPLAAEQKLSAEQQAYLREIASHPALEDFERFAHSGAVDLSWRYDLRNLETSTTHELALPRFDPYKEAAHAQAAKAALALQEGRVEEAEHAFQDAIASGVLLYDNSPLMLETLIGAVVVGHGVEALATLYEVTGRPAEAARMKEMRERAEQGSLYQIPSAESDVERVERLIAIFQDPRVPRGVKWESLYTLGMMDLCRSTPEEFEEGSLARTTWEQQAAKELVRYPGERWLLDLMRHTPEELRKRYGKVEVFKSCAQIMGPEPK